MKMKKPISMILAGAMTCSMAVTAMAANYEEWTVDSGAVVYDRDGDVADTATGTGTGALSAELNYGETYYIDLDAILGSNATTPSSVTDKNKVTLSVKKENNSTYITGTDFKTEYTLSGVAGRKNYLKITTKDNTSDKETKAEFSVILKSKKDDALVAGDKSGTQYRFKFTMWLNNDEVSDSIETGTNGIYKPSKNDENTITWSDSNNDIAELVFDTDSDADKMYAKLSTKIDNSIYTQFGDPANAELLFRSWSNVTIPSTSRAKLTLFNVYDEDVNVKDCRIYMVDGDTITDVTDAFTYDSDSEGWVTKTRTLGSYIISDVELDLDVVEELPGDVVEPIVPENPVENGNKVIPDTGRF